MMNPFRKFSWKRLVAVMKHFWQQEPREFAGESQRGFTPDHMPYIELMLPVTGVVTPVTFKRERAQKNTSTSRLR